MIIIGMVFITLAVACVAVTCIAIHMNKVSEKEIREMNEMRDSRKAISDSLRIMSQLMGQRDKLREELSDAKADIDRVENSNRLMRVKNSALRVENSALLEENKKLKKKIKKLKG